jgi:hypothetical protein
LSPNPVAPPPRLHCYPAGFNHHPALGLAW